MQNIERPDPRENLRIGDPVGFSLGKSFFVGTVLNAHRGNISNRVTAIALNVEGKCIRIMAEDIEPPF